MKQSTSEHDPFAILGVDNNASEQEVRQRYLALVKLYPPETQPAKFREIHQAYESARDPLMLAQRLLGIPRRIPEWDDVIAQQEKQPPNLSAELLIALGNRPSAKAVHNYERVDAPHE
jgi:DnaJ-domain-containing protein 1